MGFMRDLGAAASIGISATTKQKNAQASFAKANTQYETNGSKHLTTPR